MWFISDLHISHNYSELPGDDIKKIMNFLLKQKADRLILNGDIFDFARTYYIPEEYEASPIERKYGISSTPEGAALKMKIIVRFNEYFFDLLLRLVEKGWKIHFIYGNHDSELRLKEVQDLISSRLNGEIDRDIFFSISFENEFVYSEHGHQYDTENRIIYEVEDCPEEYSFGYVTTKYFANIIERESHLPACDISAGEYFLWVFKRFGLRAFGFIFQYFIYASRVIWRCFKREIYSKLDHNSHHAIPIMASLIETTKRLYLVQVTGFLLLLICSLLVLIISPSNLFIPLTALTLVLLPLFISNNKNRLSDALNESAAVLRSRYNKAIIFGHNHRRRTSDNYLSSLPQKEGESISILHFDGKMMSYKKIN